MTVVAIGEPDEARAIEPGEINTINEAMKIPERLTADDGRVFRVVGWKPTVEIGRRLMVNADLSVVLPERHD